MQIGGDRRQRGGDDGRIQIFHEQGEGDDQRGQDGGSQGGIRDGGAFHLPSHEAPKKSLAAPLFAGGPFREPELQKALAIKRRGST